MCHNRMYVFVLGLILYIEMYVVLKTFIYTYTFTTIRLYKFSGGNIYKIFLCYARSELVYQRWRTFFGPWIKDRYTHSLSFNAWDNIVYKIVSEIRSQ